MNYTNTFTIQPKSFKRKPGKIERGLIGKYVERKIYGDVIEQGEFSLKNKYEQLIERMNNVDVEIIQHFFVGKAHYIINTELKERGMSGKKALEFMKREMESWQDIPLDKIQFNVTRRQKKDKQYLRLLTKKGSMSNERYDEIKIIEKS